MCVVVLGLLPFLSIAPLQDARAADGYLDADGDLVQDEDDNCQAHPNADQADVDLDGFGNACDADCTGDAFVALVDAGKLSTEFGTDCSTLPCDCDFDGDGVVGVVDFGHLITLYGTSSGPSALERDATGDPMSGCANASAADDPCRHPLSINEPFIRTDYASGAIGVRVLYNDLAWPGTLEAHLNGQPIGIVGGPNEASFQIDAANPALRVGRNVLSVLVRSDDPSAVESENSNFASQFLLVRHRVFYRFDQDRDGLPDAQESAIGSNPLATDSDGDGLVDRVEADLSTTSASGAITITGVEPDPILPGHAVAIFGTGMENIDQVGEVTFDGAPSAAILHTSPSAVVVTAPGSLAGTSTQVALADGSGGGGASTSVGMESMPPMDVTPNLVMAAGANVQRLGSPAESAINVPSS